ncbi:hypothetical protein EJ06DRAFT_107029 [Trichodelitschia bisporula]|uniref:Uncharacterized protein n=1 Tax=Trichodelitschia bisporula TaxID=703511 RepID=A0A6G1HRN5_9PEZI|nr:hypothetical protein EJ06DRAFT_107029 [Trichodelitschia bisporula]
MQRGVCYCWCRSRRRLGNTRSRVIPSHVLSMSTSSFHWWVVLGWWLHFRFAGRRISQHAGRTRISLSHVRLGLKTLRFCTCRDFASVAKAGPSLDISRRQRQVLVQRDGAARGCDELPSSFVCFFAFRPDFDLRRLSHWSFGL